MAPFLPVISASVAAAVALAVLSLFALVAEGAGRTGPGTDSERRTLAERLVPVLHLFRPPRGVVRRWTPPDLESRLIHAGLPWSAADYASLRWAAVWVGLAAGLAAGWLRGWDLVGQFLAVVALAASLYGPAIWLSLRLEARQAEIRRSLPDFLDRLSLGLEAGLGFEVALRRSAANYPDRLGVELRRLVRQLDRGHIRSAALRELIERNPSPDLRAFVAAVLQSDRLGTSLAKTLRVQTGLLRAGRRRRAQEASRRLPILIVFPLVFFFLPALMIIYLAPPLLLLFLNR